MNSASLRKMYPRTMKKEIADIRAQLAVVESLDEDQDLDQLDYEINYLSKLVAEASRMIRDKINGKS